MTEAYCQKGLELNSARFCTRYPVLGGRLLGLLLSELRGVLLFVHVFSLPPKYSLNNAQPNAFLTPNMGQKGVSAITRYLVFVKPFASFAAPLDFEMKVCNPNCERSHFFTKSRERSHVLILTQYFEEENPIEKTTGKNQSFRIMF
jgi:hypothetical protein